jgi:2-polyprenyl-3-methyl-5-hydroxy-6-metoxy-1,4-benzoquinol methylase
MIEILKCPVCNSSDTSAFDQRKIKGVMVTNRLCNSCGLIYQSPRMDAQELETYYTSGYRKFNDGSETPTEVNITEQSKRTCHLLSQCKNLGLSVSRHLDIGCSMGILLEEFKKAYNCESVGIEPTITHRNIAAARGLRVYPTIEDLKANRETHFDLITLSHVLEHLPAPIETLQLIRTKLLSQSGHLLIEVPNVFGHQSFEPGHLFSFSEGTLLNIIKLAGFEPVMTRLHGLPRSDWRPRYILIIAKPAKNIDASWTPRHDWHGNFSIRLKRKFGIRRSKNLSAFIGHLFGKK